LFASPVRAALRLLRFVASPLTGLLSPESGPVRVVASLLRSVTIGVIKLVADVIPDAIPVKVAEVPALARADAKLDTPVAAELRLAAIELKSVTNPDGRPLNPLRSETSLFIAVAVLESPVATLFNPVADPLIAAPAPLKDVYAPLAALLTADAVVVKPAATELRPASIEATSF